MVTKPIKAPKKNGKRITDFTPAKQQRIFKNKERDYSQLIMVKVDYKTWVYRAKD